MSNSKPSKVTLTVRTPKGVQQFRRCGIEFGRKPLTVEVTVEQAEVIAKEKMLEVLSDASAKKATTQANGKASAKKGDAK